MDKFLALFKKFMDGLEWIVQERKKGPANPFLKKEIDRFETTIMSKMDIEWAKLSEAERRKFMGSEREYLHMMRTK